MLTVSYPLTSQEQAKFAHLLAVTNRGILPLPMQGSRRWVRPRGHGACVRQYLERFCHGTATALSCLNDVFADEVQ